MRSPTGGIVAWRDAGAPPVCQAGRDKREGAARIGPHVYNTMREIDRLPAVPATLEQQDDGNRFQ